MGYLRDQQGIMNRYLRESSNWKTHLEKTRAFVAQSFKTASRKSNQWESVAVLGSGWLLDVPLNDLLHDFSTVYLVDIHHPPQVRKKVENRKEVKLIEADLTGGAIEQVRKFTEKRGAGSLKAFIDSIELLPPLPEIEPSAIASVNLLNQLDIHICDHLIKKGHSNPELLKGLRKLVQAFHLEWISKHPGCLITDTREISTDKHGNEKSDSLLFTPLPKGIRGDSWSWDFDSSGRYRPGMRSRMEVQAVEWS